MNVELKRLSQENREVSGLATTSVELLLEVAVDGPLLRMSVGHGQRCRTTASMKYITIRNLCLGR